MKAFSEENEATFLEGMVFLRNIVADNSGQREEALEMIAAQIDDHLIPAQRTTLASFAVLRLAEEERAHAKTRGELDDARRDATRAREAFNALVYGSTAERYRLAWTSARQRATNRTDALIDADQERDALRALVRNVQWYGTGYLYRDGSGVDHLLSPADVTVFVSTDHETEVERLTRERDEARAEVVRLGLKSEKLIEENEQLRRDRAWEAARANEAARLSADARDDAEARDTVIADLREQVQVVEEVRLNLYAWAVNLLHEHGIEYSVGEEFAAIARFIRDLKDAVATYRHLADSSVRAREEYAQEAERLGAQCQHLVNRANEFRAARDHLLRAGRDWLDAGYPTVGKPATAGDAMASAIEDVIANVPEGQSMWVMTEYQADALRALLGLVHYDDLARSWLAMLPVEVHPQRP